MLVGSLHPDMAAGRPRKRPSKLSPNILGIKSISLMTHYGIAKERRGGNTMQCHHSISPVCQTPEIRNKTSRKTAVRVSYWFVRITRSGMTLLSEIATLELGPTPTLNRSFRKILATNRGPR